MAQYNIDWNGTSTFVREKVIPKIKDQFFKKNAMMFRLRNRAEILSGGKFIRQPLSFAPEGGGGQWWAGTDKFDTRLRQPFDSATYFFKNFEVPVIISQDEEDEVSGPEAWTSLVEAKMKLANRTIMDSLGGSLGIFNDGSNPKAMTGFQFSLQDAITSQYGGIPQAGGVNTWWNHQVDATAYTTGSGGNFIHNTNAMVLDIMLARQSLAAGRHCTMALCNWGVFNDASGLVNSKTTWFRPQQNQELAKHGFTNFQYRDVVFIVDEGVPRNSSTKVEKMYYIDEEALHLWIHAKRNFSNSDFRDAYDQAARAMYIWFRGEMGFDERRTSGVQSAITTTLTSP